MQESKTYIFYFRAPGAVFIWEFSKCFEGAWQFSPEGESSAYSAIAGFEKHTREECHLQM
jgi:hypothetical protein